VRISIVPADADYPEGVRYSLCLVDRPTGEVVLLYDIHRGKPHHRHLHGQKLPYTFVDEDTLLTDFLRDVELILEGKLWHAVVCISVFAPVPKESGRYVLLSPGSVAATSLLKHQACILRLWKTCDGSWPISGSICC
jgi:hypothetical protein